MGLGLGAHPLDRTAQALLHLHRPDPRAAIRPRDGKIGAAVGLEEYRGAASGGERGFGGGGGLEGLGVGVGVGLANPNLVVAQVVDGVGGEPR